MDCHAPVHIPDANRIIRAYSCGKCPSCTQKRVASWVFRLQQELKRSDSAIFLTLTYSDDHVPWTEEGTQTLNYKHHQNFIKSLRKAAIKRADLGGFINKSLKYYAVGEYGEETERPHFHYILFNLLGVHKTPEFLEMVWQKGKTDVLPVTNGTIGYVCGYVHKRHQFETDDPRLPTRAFQSKGLGDNYITPQIKQYYQKKEIPYLQVEGGQKIAMPKYYKDKLYNLDNKAIVNQKVQDHINDPDRQLTAKQRSEIARVEFQKRTSKNIFRRRKN